MIVLENFIFFFIMVKKESKEEVEKYVFYFFEKVGLLDKVNFYLS